MQEGVILKLWDVFSSLSIVFRTVFALTHLPKACDK